jgi:hypothetical protein
MAMAKAGSATAFAAGILAYAVCKRLMAKIIDIKESYSLTR